MAWYRLAHSLGMSKQRCQLDAPAKELPKWIWFLDWKERQRTPDQYYLAQIALETTSRTDKKSLDDFMLDIEMKAADDDENELDQEAMDRLDRQLELVFFGALGIENEEDYYVADGRTTDGL